MMSQNLLMSEWDEKKNQQNIEKHGISFEQAIGIFEAFTFTTRSKYEGEERYETIGYLEGRVPLMVVHTNRSGKCRIISARIARRTERKLYEEALHKTPHD